MNIRDELLTALQQGSFLKIVYEKSIREHDNVDNFITEIISLHNENQINIINILKESGDSENNNELWHSIYTVFSNVIPKLNASIPLVIECISSLIKKAKGTESTLFKSYVEFCNVDENRFKEALVLIENNIPELINFLHYTLIYGSKLDIEYYLNATLRLLAHENIEVRKTAISSLGNLQYLQNASFSEQAIFALENIEHQETDKDLLASLTYAAFDLYRQDKSKEHRVVKLITSIVDKNNDILQLTTNLFLYSNILPEPLLNIAFSYLHYDLNTLNLIDLGLSHLLESGKSDKAIYFLENLLIKNHNDLSLSNFPCVFSFFTNDKNIKLLNRIVTRWFLLGDRVLCNGIHDIVGQSINSNILLSIDTSELDVKNANHCFFVARKAMGYLFFCPVTVASIIVSLIEQTNDIQTINTLGGFLFDPLLINYQGKLKDYLVEQLKSENQNVKTIIDLVLKESDNYFDNIKSVGDIPELNPSQSQQEAYWRHHSRMMTDTMRESEKESFLSSLFSKSVLLYGNKSIIYVEGFHNEEPRRMEMPLQTHSYSFECPRTEHIDSLGLNYMLLMFKIEKIKALPDFAG